MDDILTLMWSLLEENLVKPLGQLFVTLGVEETSGCFFCLGFSDEVIYLINLGCRCCRPSGVYSFKFNTFAAPIFILVNFFGTFKETHSKIHKLSFKDI